MQKVKENSFGEFMRKRENQLLNEIIMTEDGRFVPVSEVNPKLLLEKTIQKAATYRAKFAPQIRSIASDQAHADKSDPFTHSRTLNNLLCGCGDLSDMGVEFLRHAEVLDGPNGPVEKVIYEPIRWRHT